MTDPITNGLALLLRGRAVEAQRESKQRSRESVDPRASDVRDTFTGFGQQLYYDANGDQCSYQAWLICRQRDSAEWSARAREYREAYQALLSREPLDWLYEGLRAVALFAVRGHPAVPEEDYERARDLLQHVAWKGLPK